VGQVVGGVGGDDALTLAPGEERAGGGEALADAVVCEAAAVAGYPSAQGGGVYLLRMGVFGEEVGQVAVYPEACRGVRVATEELLKRRI
jgi:hypothetical protein